MSERAASPPAPASAPTLTAQLAPQLAPQLTPRPVTAKARRRSWHEPVISGWLLGGIVLLGMAVQSGVTAVRANADQNWLLARGTPIEATIFASERGHVSGVAYSPDSNFTLNFQWQGKPALLPHSFTERHDTVISGSKVMLHIDPNDVNHWTLQTVPVDRLSGLTSACILAALSLMLFGLAMLLRRQRLRIFQYGERVDAIVVDTRANPLAPLSTGVRCIIPSVGNRRLITVYVPRSAGRVAKEDVIPLIIIPQKPERAIAASAYLE